MVMFSEDYSTRLLVNLGLIGTLLGVVVRFVTHSNIAVLIGVVGGLLVAFLLTAVRGEQFLERADLPFGRGGLRPAGYPWQSPP